MKKLLCLIALAICFASCNNEKHIYIYSDMMYFLDNGSINEGYVSPVTTMTAATQSQVDLLVMRNGFVAERYPKQAASIVVVEGAGMAKLGTDFSLSTQTFDFSGKSNTHLPLLVNTFSSASGKKIVLKLDYTDYGECPETSRTANKLVITVK